jgi:ribosomal protein S18 acetylase RimI-like enzyme
LEIDHGNSQRPDLPQAVGSAVKCERMATFSDALVHVQAKGHLRPFDHNRDLLPVADLVEVSFDDSIDADGQRYLRQMRDAARNPNFLRWANAVVDQASLPLSGFVWEEDGRLVGNLSLIPFQLNSKRNYLVANVAVHPNYRRRGIGRALTAAAIDHAHRRGAASTWLHVREENEAAIQLYLSLGFVEHTRRSTWHAPAHIPDHYAGTRNYQVSSRRKEHWPQQEAWLNRLYPPEVAWHFPLNLNHFRADLVGFFYQIISGAGLRHWIIQSNGELEGIVSWRPSLGHYNQIWLAIPVEYKELVVESLLVYAMNKVSASRPVALDFPARVADGAVQAAGFSLHQTLIWMVTS